MKPNATVFLVEDDPGIQRAISELMVNWGICCETFSSAEEYLEATSGSRPGCLLLDHKLSGIDGLKLQQELADRNDTTPIVVMSGAATVQMTLQYLENGALTLLEKPCTPEDIRHAVTSAIEFDRRQAELAKRFEDLKSFDESLSDRERNVLERVVRGQLNKSIARDLEVSQRTVENTRARLLRKFHAETAAELAAKAAELRVLSDSVFRTDQAMLHHYRRKARHSKAVTVDRC